MFTLVKVMLGTLLFQLLGDGSYGSSVGSRKTGSSSVFSLFNLKEKSRFWSESVILSGENVNSFFRLFNLLRELFINYI